MASALREQRNSREYLSANLKSKRLLFARNKINRHDASIQTHRPLSTIPQMERVYCDVLGSHNTRVNLANSDLVYL